MSSASPEKAPGGLSKGTLAVMSLACGVSVANIIYNQPLLGDFARDFHASPEAAGQVATASQIGYGIGLLFLLPLGDLTDRRRLVLLLTLVCAALMAGTAFAPTLFALVALHFLIGVTSMSAQVLIPMSVEMSPPDKRGHTVGTLMTGLLGGILLARTLAGFFSDHFGWRAMYGLGAGMMGLLALLLAAKLPHRPVTTDLSYPELMRSLFRLLKTKRNTWSSGIVSGLSFGSFTAFWTTLSFLMAARFHGGASEAGLFGVVGLFGALGAPVAGRIADRLGTRILVGVSLAVCMLAFVAMGAWVSIPMLIAGVLVMDMGAQSVQVAEQSKVIALVPEARSRINALYMVTRFAGGAAGSLIGAYAWSHGGWIAVCVAAAGLNLAALAIHFAAAKFGRAPEAGKLTGSEEFVENAIG